MARIGRYEMCGVIFLFHFLLDELRVFKIGVNSSKPLICEPVCFIVFTK